MEREKVRAFHKDLNTALDMLAKKHGFASARTNTMSYTDTQMTCRVRVLVTPEARTQEASRNLAVLGLTVNEKVEVNGRIYEVIDATARGSLIIVSGGKRYRLSPRMHYKKVGQKTTGMTEEIRKQFEDLAMRLSPENLSCDGELSSSATRARYTELQRLWRNLEAQVGRKVTEDEIWDVVIARQKEGVHA